MKIIGIVCSVLMEFFLGVATTRWRIHLGVFATESEFEGSWRKVWVWHQNREESDQSVVVSGVITLGVLIVSWWYTTISTFGERWSSAEIARPTCVTRYTWTLNRGKVLRGKVFPTPAWSARLTSTSQDRRSSEIIPPTDARTRNHADTIWNSIGAFPASPL